MNQKEKSPTIHAPFTDEQVKQLNEYQKEGIMHPFTCGGKHCDRSAREDEGLLIATNKGWVCPCGKYKQRWAWEFMLHTDEMKAKRKEIFGKL